LDGDSLFVDADGDTVDSRNCMVVEVVPHHLMVPAPAIRDLVAAHVVLLGIAAIE
jgi:hypothetical protein